MTVSNLVGNGGPGFIRWTWTLTDEHENGLPYLQVDAVEVRVSANSNFASGVKIGEGRTEFLQTGLVTTAPFFAWIRARDKSGNFSEWHPLSTQPGVAGASSTSLDIGTITGKQFVLTPQGTFGLSILATGGAGMEIFNEGGGNSVAIVNEGGGNIFEVQHSAGGDIFDIEHLGGGNIFTIRAGGGGMIFDIEVPGALEMLLTNGGWAASTDAGITPFNVTHSGGGNGFGIVHSGGGTGIQCSRSSGSGFAIRSENTAPGGFDFYAAAGGYGPFTGQHEALIPKIMECEPGDLVCDVDIVARNGISNALAEVARSTQPNQRGVIGVMVNRSVLVRDKVLACGPIDDDLFESHDYVILNALGEGLINVCGENGPIQRGDLLVASSVPGKAMRQSDDIVRSYTVARSRENAELDENDVAVIACVYLSG